MALTRTTILAVTGVLLCFASPAFADTSTPTPPTPGPSTPDPSTPDPSTTIPTVTRKVPGPTQPSPSTPTPADSVAVDQAAMNQKFQTTTAAMLSLYQQQAQGSSADLLASLGISDLGGSTISSSSLNAAVSAAGIGGDFASLMSAPSGLDGAVAAAGRAWAQELAATQSKALGTLGDSTTQLPSAQALGALLAKSTTNMLNADPNGFAKLQQGIADPLALTNWSNSVKAAGLEGAGMSGAPSVLDPCMAAMLAAAGSGNPAVGASAGNACGQGSSACVTAGLYFHSKLLDAVTGGSSANGVLPPADFNQLQPWQRQALSGGQGGTSLTGALQGGSGGCGAATAVDAATSALVPAAWKALTAPFPATPTTPTAALTTQPAVAPKGWGAITKNGMP